MFEKQFNPINPNKETDDMVARVPFTNYTVEQLAEIVGEYRYVDVTFDGFNSVKLYEYRVPHGVQVLEGDLCVVLRANSTGFGPSDFAVARVAKVKSQSTNTSQESRKFIVGAVSQADYMKALEVDKEIANAIRNEQENTMREAVLQSIKGAFPALQKLLPTIKSETNEVKE